MSDPWTWTVGAGGGLGRGGQRGKNWDNCNRIRMKYLKNKQKISLEIKKIYYDGSLSIIPEE